MTCREKLKIDHPDCWRELLLHCPRDFGYLNPEYTPCYTLDCDMCWSLPLHYQDRVLYLCDRKQCVNCSYPTCKHTQDISHAVNFKRQEDATDPRRTPYFWYETSEDDVETQNEEGGRRMTCRERLKLEHPAAECYDVEESRCPSEFGYLDDPEWCIVSDKVCERCWDREIPDDFSESKYLHSLGESLAEEFHSSVNQSEKSSENILAMCFSELIDAVSQGKVTVHYDIKSGIFKIIPAKIVRRDEEVDKR